MPRLTRRIRRPRRNGSDDVIHVHLLDAAGHLREYREEILERTHHTIAQVRALMPVEQVDVLILENPSWTIPSIGLGGLSANAHFVQVSLDPSHADFKQNLERELPPLLAHELHHAMRWHGPGPGETLLTALVMEGLAQAFELPFRNGQPPEWAILKDPSRMDELMNLARLEFDKAYDHDVWFFGKDAPRIPTWTGYALGFEIVKNYLEKADTTAGKSHAVTAQEVLATLEA
jgi:uncharacterized protein YjaZ